MIVAVRIAERLAELRRLIGEAARLAGRRASEVVLVAVTKNTNEAAIREAAAAGQRDFGENYVQRGLDRARSPDLGGLRWHLIGALQSNKAARAARGFWLLHGLDSVSAARAISRAMVADGSTCRVLLQIKLGGGTARAGVRPDGALGFLHELSALPGLQIDGVMGVADPAREARPQFAMLRELLERLRAEGLPGAPLREMSAGMSQDYVDAILEGSTMVRIGSAIFGAPEEQNR
ncbi:MAG: YggS family pyridoxal phosphate-dependent enzyme [Candidatus Binatia bacterium]